MLLKFMSFCCIGQKTLIYARVFVSLIIHFISCYLFRYTSLDDSSDLASQKRSNVSLICQENKKRRKVPKPEVLTVQIAV